MYQEKLYITEHLFAAWKVDFNLALPSYDLDLKAVRNLVELALSSPYVTPPHIEFVSSVGVLRSEPSNSLPSRKAPRLKGFVVDCNPDQTITEDPLDPSSALGTGYSEAKWISERILLNVAERHTVPLTIVRLGQVCGDRLGHWNEKEWFPALVKSALSTHCLPDLEVSKSSLTYVFPAIS